MTNGASMCTTDNARNGHEIDPRASYHWPGSQRTSRKRSSKAVSPLTSRPGPCVICRSFRPTGPIGAGSLGSSWPEPQHKASRDITRDPPAETLRGNRRFWPQTETKSNRSPEPAPLKARKPRHNTTRGNIRR